VQSPDGVSVLEVGQGGCSRRKWRFGLADGKAPMAGYLCFSILAKNHNFLEMKVARGEMPTGEGLADHLLQRAGPREWYHHRRLRDDKTVEDRWSRGCIAGDSPASSAEEVYSGKVC
jgi:hypothetical protein